MMRRTPAHRGSAVGNYRVRLATDLQYKGEGKTHSGFKEPYSIWTWKQNEVYRAIHEYQFEHLRRLYKRQWFEAFRVNADEYVSKYSVTKAATLAKWEAEMQEQEAQRQQVVEREQGRAALLDKHRDIMREMHEKQFFHWYERAAERLQYFAAQKFVRREDLEAHIERELNKYVVGNPRAPEEGSDADRGAPAAYPLNFVGQMPLLESEDLEVVAAAPHMATTMRAMGADGRPMEVYAPPRAAGAASEDGGLVGDEISADVKPLEEEDELRLRAAVMQSLTEEQEALTRNDSDHAVSTLSDDESEINRRKYIDRGQTGMHRRQWKKGGARDDLESVVSAPSVKELDDTVKAAAAAERRERKKKARTEAAAASGTAPDVGSEEDGIAAAAAAALGRAPQKRKAGADAVPATDGEPRRRQSARERRRGAHASADHMSRVKAFQDAGGGGADVFKMMKENKPKPRGPGQK